MQTFHLMKHNVDDDKKYDEEILSSHNRLVIAAEVSAANQYANKHGFDRVSYYMETRAN